MHDNDHVLYGPTPHQTVRDWFYMSFYAVFMRLLFPASLAGSLRG